MTTFPMTFISGPGRVKRALAAIVTALLYLLGAAWMFVLTGGWLVCYIAGSLARTFVALLLVTALIQVLA